MPEEVLAQVAEPVGLGGPGGEDGVVVGQEGVGGGELAQPQRAVRVLGLRPGGLRGVPAGAAGEQLEPGERPEGQEGPACGRGHRCSSG
ncbi:hypothetical protein HUT16_24515 [Kitasatospora sp. NA04385]|uniref:hypothetical protein n=1 Tax=Kitasatospora sp. NA04385 TaxID=2742135 RepID=UPI00158FCAB9|nr:hypothetical protein [Kitasatospora sp. NA04385]QKW21799.1 hypothetical protein HUT16_24515 [Kitasatospora sp. NA04385]